MSNNIKPLLNSTKKNNRQHDRLKNIPVYGIGGHGGQLNDTFIVPKGCKIVTHIHYGDVSWSDEVSLQFGLLSMLSDDILYTPEIHSSRIIDKIGSIAIYTEGQSCPNFSYQLNACFNKSVCNSMYSGIIPIKYYSLGDYMPFRTYNEFIQNAKKVRDIIDIVADMYRYSIYPTRQEIFDLCLNIIKNTPNLHKYKNIDTNITGDESLEILTYLLDLLETESFNNNIPINITQKELCHQFPGVYYNLICRPDITYMEEINRNFQPFQNKYNNFVYNNPNTNPNNKGLLKKALLKKITHNRIKEAHMQRRPYIRNYINTKDKYYNSKIKNLDETIKKYKNNDDEFNTDSSVIIKKLQKLNKKLKSLETELIILQNNSTNSSNVNIKINIGDLKHNIENCKMNIRQILLRDMYPETNGGKYRIQKTRKRK